MGVLMESKKKIEMKDSPFFEYKKEGQMKIVSIDEVFHEHHLKEYVDIVVRTDEEGAKKLCIGNCKIIQKNLR